MRVAWQLEETFLRGHHTVAETFFGQHLFQDYFCQCIHSCSLYGIFISLQGIPHHYLSMEHVFHTHYLYEPADSISKLADHNFLKGFEEVFWHIKHL